MRVHYVLLAGVAIQAVACKAPTGPPVARGVNAVSALAYSGFTGEPLADSIRVRVTDQYGEPLAGVAVAWAASSGIVSPRLTHTDAAGLTAAAWHLGGDAFQQVLATVADLTPVTFTARPTARRYELVTSFQTFTYFVYCKTGYGYCTETVAAGDARLIGTLRTTVGDTVTLERHLHPRDPSTRGPLTYRVGPGYLGYGTAVEYVHLWGSRSGDSIAGPIRWETKTGPSGQYYSGTFVLRPVR